MYSFYIHFISPSIVSSNTSNIYTHTLTHTPIHTQIIYTHIRYDPLRGGADTPFHALDMYKPNVNSNFFWCYHFGEWRCIYMYKSSAAARTRSSRLV